MAQHPCGCSLCASTVAAVNQLRADLVELHSEIESYRRVLKFRTPPGEEATVLVMRRRGAVCLTLNGAEKTTVVMHDQDSRELVEALSCASGDCSERRPDRLM